ncbi:glycosyltransferase family 4 protein [Rheinheimera sp. 4Y26]|uniref:glycosyltransferase family 4 protein n=1 Tax=Rheinheimera sp. 4Y26 TaxID=2977811 RepID=UPI0021B0FFD7|nr:glycosyltransferase family 4 protein [Rheinheimera sp. 4Y26]MCT6700621.1 glycosyltransferase family 4 protein [Rheinheimera sp. 4Y26]
MNKLSGAEKGAYHGTSPGKKLVIVTTVPDTLELILESQPQFLNGFYQVVVVSSAPQRLAAFAQKEGVDFDVVPMNRGISPFEDINSIVQMYRVLRKHRPDLVHSYTPKAGMVSAIAGFFARVPVRVHTFTGLIFPYCSGVKKFILKQIDRVICCLNTHIVPEGEGVKQTLAPLCHKPLKVIGYGNIAGVNLMHFNPSEPEVVARAAALKSELGLCGKTVFCFVGRLNNDKGIKELCDAFLTLDPQKNALLIVGGLDDENPVDVQTLQKLQLSPAICLLGFQPDVRVALLAADVFVLPSYREGFPNVVLQAGAMAKPALVTDVHGSNEIVQQGVNGWIVPVRDSQALSAQMQMIGGMTQSELAEVGRQALALVHDRFERSFYQRQLLAFYQDILS